MRSCLILTHYEYQVSITILLRAGYTSMNCFHTTRSVTTQQEDRETIVSRSA
jgi:3'-phosphoadenosine 5'-phosphosulfate sulfotransferase (PAPS reductase)/FAD synthetase